jgi:hypothetical protein
MDHLSFMKTNATIYRLSQKSSAPPNKEGAGGFFFCELNSAVPRRSLSASIVSAEARLAGTQNLSGCRAAAKLLVRFWCRRETPEALVCSSQKKNPPAPSSPNFELACF